MQDEDRHEKEDEEAIRRAGLQSMKTSTTDDRHSPVLDSNLHFFPPAAANFLARQMARSSAHEFGADNGAACVGPERVLCRLVEKGRCVAADRVRPRAGSAYVVGHSAI